MPHCAAMPLGGGYTQQVQVLAYVFFQGEGVLCFVSAPETVEPVFEGEAVVRVFFVEDEAVGYVYELAAVVVVEKTGEFCIA